MLREIASKKKVAFMQSLVGTVVEAITLQSGGKEFTEAMTDNYLKMRIFGPHAPNRWIDLKVEGVSGEMILGKPLVNPSREPAFGEPSHPAGGDWGVRLQEQTH